MSQNCSGSAVQEQSADPPSLAPLLRTKLFIPPVRSDQIARPRLIELLDGSLKNTLTLLSAPAGYGKTSLLASWLHETRVASAWFALDKRDNDPIRFLHYLLTAIQQIVPTVGLDLLDMLHGIQPPPYEALLSLVINDIIKNCSRDRRTRLQLLNPS